MEIKAEDLVENAAAWLPGIEVAARLSGMKVLHSAVAILRRAIQYPEVKGQLIEWLRYLPMVGAEPGAEATGEPPLPAEFSDLQEEAIDLRLGCQNCED